jgi:phosphoglycolate phosphatase-like HAD superfamily hydrolase
VATIRTCRRTKPHPDPILWTAEQLEITSRDCLMVGDTTVDIRAARSAGAQSVGVLSGFGSERELRRAGADVILRDVTGLVDFFP